MLFKRIKVSSIGWILIFPLLTGCGTTYKQVRGDAYPTLKSISHPIASVGITQNTQSSSPGGTSTSTIEIVELLSKMLLKEGIFKPVIFPYTELARAEPEVLIDVTVSIHEKYHWTENFLKIAATGATFFILSPVLPIRFGFEIETDVDVKLFSGTPIKKYSSTVEYDLLYTSPMPNKKIFDEWLAKTIDHAVLDIIDQIIKDQSKLENAVGPSEY